MSEAVRIEWTYKPSDYFEESWSFEIGEAHVEIADGYAVAVVPAALYDQNEGIRDEISEHIKHRFLGAQIMNHRRFNLSHASVRRPDPQGRGSTVLSRITADAVIVSGRADLTITDAEGNVITDTKAERIADRKRLADLAAKHAPNDPTLRRMLESYNAAVKDPDSELVHLYEIRDALQTRFRGQKKARQRAGIIRDGWKRLGDLACKLPLSQGRHRGQHPDQLRNATNAELSEARSIARQMIEGYLTYLEH
jgi:hypothetical protein